MYLTSLQLRDFRNYAKRTLNFGRGTTLIVGRNGSGKTNILEALYLLASGRSFRAQLIDEMIHFDRELSHVVGTVVSQEQQPSSETELMITLTRGEIQGKRVAKRRYRVDGASKRLNGFVGKLVAVLFRPEDLQLILGSPGRRRAFLDDTLLQVDRNYRRSRISYERALVRRNRLLDAIRDGKAQRTQLTFWDQLLIKHGQELTNRRAAFLEYINGFQTSLNSFQVVYESSAISEGRLQTYAEQEIAAGFTFIGPHKDDFLVKFSDDRALVSYGSRGEQRLAVLWLKLTELAFVSQKLGERPLLLLDDILSELDQEHRERVFEILPRQQTIVTATDVGLIQSKYRKALDTIALS